MVGEMLQQPTHVLAVSPIQHKNSTTKEDCKNRARER